LVIFFIFSPVRRKEWSRKAPRVAEPLASGKDGNSTQQNFKAEIFDSGNKKGTPENSCALEEVFCRQSENGTRRPKISAA
jgi:hypothetical protein